MPMGKHWLVTIDSLMVSNHLTDFSIQRQPRGRKLIPSDPLKHELKTHSVLGPLSLGFTISLTNTSRYGLVPHLVMSCSYQRAVSKLYEIPHATF